MCLKANGCTIRIVRGRLGRRPLNIGGSPIYDPVENQQQLASPFTSINPNILSNNAPSTTEPQSQQSDTSSALQNGVQGGNSFGASQSLAPNQPSGTQSANLAASGKATSMTSSLPPASTFSFTPSATLHNPFAPGNVPILHPKSFSGAEGSIAGGSSGFRGSIFNVAAGRDSVPLFAPMPSEPMSNLSSQAEKGTEPESSSFTPAKPSDFVQTPATTNRLGQSAVQQAYTTPTTTNIFGQSLGSTSQLRSSSNGSIQSAEKMQISPDATPAKFDAPKTGAFSFLTQPQKDSSTELNTQSDATVSYPKLNQPSSMPNPTPTNTDGSTAKPNMFSAISRPIATTKAAFATPAPKTGGGKGLFSGLLMPPSTQSPLAKRKQSNTAPTTMFRGGLNSPKPTISTQPPVSTAETPVQKEKLTNGISGAASATPATGGSQTSNMFRNIVGNSKAPGMGGQKEKSTNEVNGGSAFPQTNKMPQASSHFGITPEQPKVTDLGKDDRFMGMPPPAPAHFTEDQKNHYVTLYRIRSLDSSFQKHIANMTELRPGDVELAVRFYTETHEKILAAAGSPREGLLGNKRKLTGDETPGEDGRPNKKSKSLAEGTPAVQANGGPLSSNTFNNPPVTVKPPTFGTGEPVNFLAQFGQSVAETERKEKAKRKAEDFDSDEDDEAEWERKDAEEQRAKKQKVEEAAKGKIAKFVPGKGFVIEEKEQTEEAVTKDKSVAAPAPAFEPSIAKPPVSNGVGFSGFSNSTAQAPEPNTTKPPVSNATNIFGSFTSTATAFESNAKRAPVSNGTDLFGSGTSTPSTAGGASVFDSPNLAGQQNTISTNNIFGHLSDADSGADGSNSEDADHDIPSHGHERQDTHDNHGNTPAQESPNTSSFDQLSESDEDEDIQSVLRKSRSAEVMAKVNAPSDKQPVNGTASGRSLFDRISKDENGNNLRQLPTAEEKKPDNPFNPSRSATPSTLFGKTTAPATSFGQSSAPAPGSKIFGSFSNSTSNRTWKQDTPIKFAGNTAAPTFSFTNATPSKNTSAEDKAKPSSPFEGLFGQPKTTTESPAPSPSNIFGSSTNKSVVGFGFGGPPKSAASSLLAASAPGSAASSRATSPGMTTDTGGESAYESAAEGAEVENPSNAKQLNLTTAGPGEEDEDVIFEVRAKALKWLAKATDEQTKPGWQNKGVGTFRVLKHRQTGKARIVMRLDPSGRLVLNAALLDGVKYQHQAPAAVKMAVASEGGKLTTWVVKVKRDEDAIELASILEENKSN